MARSDSSGNKGAGGRVRVVRFASPLRQALGLMFRTARPGTLYLFDFGRPVRHAFHMWFVFRPIDLFLLDERLRVVETRRGFRPFTIHVPNSDYCYAVETRCGLLRKTDFPGVLKCRSASDGN